MNELVEAAARAVRDVDPQGFNNIWMSYARAALTAAKVPELLALVEAARECMSACDLAPNAPGSSKRRQWCIAHAEWTPCSHDELRAALASLDLP